MKKCLLVTFIIVISCSLLNAQELYKLPPKEVIDIVSAPPTPEISISPTGDFMLLAGYESMPSIAYLAQPLLRIAGIRITPKNTSRQQITFYTDFTIKKKNIVLFLKYKKMLEKVKSLL